MTMAGETLRESRIVRLALITNDAPGPCGMAFEQCFPEE